MKTRRQTHASRARAGFTLVEILAVLVIISILFAFVLTRIMSGEDIVRAENTRQFIAQVSAAISEYENEMGDYPPSSFDAKFEAPNKVNMGAEALFLALYGKEWQGPELPEDRLGNSDDDATKKSWTTFSSPSLFEICDDWGNPIAYYHRRDYETPHTYASIDGETGEYLEAPAPPMKNTKTGDPFNRSSYQLISAGPDGVFGPNPDNDDLIDDIANFKFDATEQ